MTLPLSGILVIALEQAVAAPMCTSRLADAGARVIKIERPEGDFARGYDDLVHGECSYFVWLNRGKESVVLDLTKAEDKALLAAMLKRADVFVQNLKPGAAAKLGFSPALLRRDNPRLICCSISGFGESGPLAHAQGLRHADPGRIRSRLDHRHIGAVARRCLRCRCRVRHVRAAGDPRGADRARTHRRRRRAFDLHVRCHGRLDDGAAVAGGSRLHAAAHRPRPHLDLALRRVPQPRRRRHPDFDPERPRMASACRKVLGDAKLAADPDFATNVERVKRRDQTDGKVAAVFAALDADALEQKLAAADIAFARVNTPADLSHHPHLRRITIGTPSGPVSYPAPAERRAAASRHYGPVPALGEHTDKVRAEIEFMPATNRKTQR
jgi:itaconate CoA-transferase